MNKILTPLDFSDVAMNGLKYAFELAKKLRAELILFHAVSVHPSGAKVVSQDLDAIEEDAKEKLESICEKMATGNALSGINYMFEVRIGLAEDEILKVVKEKNIDLVIMGTKGADGFDSFTGTISSDIAVNASCPVLVIPKDYHYAPIRNIIFATDLTGEDSDEISFVAALAGPFEAHISFLNIQKENKPRNQELLDKGFNLLNQNEYKDMSFHVIEKEDIIEGINSFAEEQAGDLIVMSTHRRNVLQSLFSRSHTRQLAYHTRIPLLAMHKEKIIKEISSR